MKTANDPIPVLRRVFAFLERDDLPNAADCFLEGFRRVLVLEMQHYKVAPPPKALDRRKFLVASLRRLKTSKELGMTDDHVALWMDLIDQSTAVLNGKPRHPDVIGRGAFQLTAAYMGQPYYPGGEA